MTRLEIRTLILSWLDDTQAGYFTPAQVNVWINLAQRQVQMMLLQAGNNWYMKPVQTIMVTGQYDYVLPADFMVEHRLEVILSGTGPSEVRQPLGMITTNQQDMVSIANGTPQAYYIKKDRVTVSPPPQQGYTMRLYYSPRVVDLTGDSDTPDVPEQYMEYLAILAAYDGFIKDDRSPEILLAKKTKYEELFKQMAVDRVQDSSRQIVQTQDYDSGGAWF